MKSQRNLLVLYILMVGMILCACQYAGVPTYESYVTDIANDGVLDSSSYTAIWDQSYWTEDMLLNSRQTITFDSVEYTGTYDKSIYELYQSYITDYYKTDDGTQFHVRRDTGELVAISFMNKSFYETEPYMNDVADPAATALSVASNVAEQYLTNITDYTVEIEDPDYKTKEKDGVTYSYSYHRINYIKYIDGYHSSDYLSVVVTSKGHIATVIMGSIGTFDRTNVTVDKNLLAKKVSDTTYAAYVETPYTLQNYNVSKQYLAVTPDGKICICSELTVTLSTANNTQFSSGIRVLTEIA